MVGYLLCGIGILTTSIFFLFLGNFVAGLMGVNLSTTNAIISDVSVNEKRSKFFAISHLMLRDRLYLRTFCRRQGRCLFPACFRRLFLSLFILRDFLFN